MNIFIICSVRGVSDEYRKKLERYVENLEKDGNKVHLPHRDTNQEQNGQAICQQNKDAIIWSDEIHIFYDGKSQGALFDLGMAFALNKKIKIIENHWTDEIRQLKKSFPKMLDEWERMGNII